MIKDKKCLECNKEVDTKGFCKECYRYLEDGDYYND